jgi:S-adenosylmethionine-diacylglycerol 3-amino-3-carboxypropyl transferase
MDTAFPPWVEAAARLPIAFAQVREDAELDAWVVRRHGRGVEMLLVASGGCTAAYLAAQLEVARLHLVDPNPAQLALARLKLYLLQHSEPSERLALLGHRGMAAAERRQRLAAALHALELSPELLGPVEAWAENGPDHSGRYERVFAQLRHELREQSAALTELLQLCEPGEQARRIAPETELGRALDAAFEAAMSLPILVRLFGEGATRNRCEPFAHHFARRTRHVLATLPAADNPYLHQVLRGSYPATTVAPWLAIAGPPQLPHIEFANMVMTQALAAAPRAFDVIHLSNILDWLSPEEARTTLDLTWKALRPGGSVFIRQLNSRLDIPAAGEGFDWQTEEARQLHARDRSYFYRALHLGSKR